MEIFNIFFQLQVMETIRNQSIFTFFVVYLYFRRHFTSRNKVGCLILAHHEHFEPNIGQGFNIPKFKCSECANIPLPHLGSVFFRVKFRQHAFLFKTSLMMLNI
jgi:hypothetical protein